MPSSIFSGWDNLILTKTVFVLVNSLCIFFQNYNNIFIQQQQTKEKLFFGITVKQHTFCQLHRNFFVHYFFLKTSETFHLFYSLTSVMSTTSHKGRSRTEISETVYIPPLKLPDYFQSSPKHQKTKEAQTFLQSVPLDKNSEFLKEKSLYRYTISRKINRFLKTQPFQTTPGGGTNLSKSKQKEEQPSIKREHSRQTNLMSKGQQNEEERRKYFRRKNRNLFQKSFTNISGGSMTGAVDQTEKVITNITTNKNCYNSQNNYQQRIQTLRKSNQSLVKENQNIKELLKEKNKLLDNYQEEIKLLKKENEKLLREMHRNITLQSESFIHDQKIENQIRLRDTIIDQLESNLKYIQLENLTLKKAKLECSRQASIIINLERERKILQEKVKKLYKQKTKRRNMKGSINSECSDMSLNLSFDEQQSQKRVELLKTSERTPQKLKNVQIYKGNSLSKGSDELFSRQFKGKPLK